MLTSIEWAQPALDDLLAIREYCAGIHEPDVGSSLVARIYKAAGVLQDFPRAGRPGLVQETRELLLPHLPYFLVYRIQSQRVDILRGMHMTRLWVGNTDT